MKTDFYGGEKRSLWGNIHIVCIIHTIHILHILHTKSTPKPDFTGGKPDFSGGKPDFSGGNPDERNPLIILNIYKHTSPLNPSGRAVM